MTGEDQREQHRRWGRPGSDPDDLRPGLIDPSAHRSAGTGSVPAAGPDFVGPPRTDVPVLDPGPSAPELALHLDRTEPSDPVDQLGIGTSADRPVPPPPTRRRQVVRAVAALAVLAVLAVAGSVVLTERRTTYTAPQVQQVAREWAAPEEIAVLQASELGALLGARADPERCRAVILPTDRVQDGVSAEARSRGRRLEVNVLRYPSPSVARRVLTEVRTAVAACPTVELRAVAGDPDEPGLELQTGVIDSGDQTDRIHYTLGGDGSTYDLYVRQLGNLLVWSLGSGGRYSQNARVRAVDDLTDRLGATR